MKITLITVCYNSALTIEDTLKSVITQTYQNIEYIVIDGTSTDSTLEIVNRYSKHISAIISEPDNGMYDALNKVKKEVYEKYGMFNLALKSAADYELMLRFLFKHKVPTEYLPKNCVKMRIGGMSNSSLSNRINANKEDRRAWKINEIKPYFFTLYLKPFRKVFQYFLNYWNISSCGG